MDALPLFGTLGLVDIYVIYGMSLLILAMGIYLQPKYPEVLPLSNHFWLLSVFGILRGSKALLEGWQLSTNATGISIEWLNAVLLVLSSVPLVEFARRGIRQWGQARSPRMMQLASPWIYILAGVLLLFFTLTYSVTGLYLGTSYLLGVPGALLTGLILLWALKQIPSDKFHSAGFLGNSAGGAFIVYGLLTVWVAEKTMGIPAWVPTHESFFLLFGVPVQLLLAVCAIIAALTLSLIVRQLAIQAFQRERETSVQLRALTSTLEQRVTDRMQELECANQKLLAEIAERSRTTEALKASEIRLNEAQRIARIGSWELDLVNNILLWSDEIFRIFEIDKDKFGASYEAFLGAIHPDDRSMVNQAYTSSLATKTPYMIRHRLRMIDGRIKYVQEQCETFYDISGNPLRSIGTVQDITLQVQAEEALQRSVEELKQVEQRERELRQIAEREQGRMAALLSAMSIGILFEDRDSRVEYANPAFRAMWAIADDLELTGQPVVEVLHRSTHQFARPDHASKYVLRVLDTHEISERFEVDLYDGRILTQISYPVMDSDGRILGRLWIYEDVTHERQTAAQLLYLAERDPLTGLYNRHRFQERLEQLIASSQRTGARFALLYFDLDEFKYINDTFGHRAGDTVLVRMAGEISNLVRSSEIFARLGGDEFAILTMLQPDDDLLALPKRIISAVSSIPLRFRGSNLRLTASIGVAIYPEHGENAENLVAHADAAMYQAKSQGKNTCFIYDPARDMSEAMMEHMTWNHRISQALQGDFFELHFQGIYRAIDRELSHLEVLIRMRDPGHPERLIMPNQFIPHAEKSGQILEVDRWVIRRSIEILKTHPKLSALAVNVSGRSVDDPALPNFIRDQLETQGIDPKRLIIELTETAAVSDIQDAQRFIEALQRSGCRVSLDDFGSGFSTFAYLKHLGVEILKIDGLFIHDLPNNPDNQAFVRAMTEIARGLHKRTIAEFVEDQATLDMVRDIGVEFVQGYYLDRPIANHPALC